MDNWRDIGTSTAEGLRALDVFMAQRIGYTVNRRADGVWDLILPDGRPYCPIPFDCKNEGEAWGAAAINIEQRYPNNPPIIPHYTTDLNAAAGLPFDLPTGYTLSVTTYADGSVYSRVYDKHKIPVALTRTAECFKSEALSRSLTWLAWKDMQTETEQLG